MMNKNVYFQQDGATAHTAKRTIELIKKKFDGKLISKFGDINWPPRSPDLTPCDFFLWGYLKSRVYCNKPPSIFALQKNIRKEVRSM